MTYAENGKQMMLKVKALCPPGLSPCRGLVSKNDQCAADRVLGPAPGLLVALWVLWPVPSFSDLDAHICKIGSGHGSWLLYFLKGDRGGWVCGGQLQKEFQKTTVGEPTRFALFRGRERAALAWSEPLDTPFRGLDSWEHFCEITLLPSPKRKIWQEKAVHTHPPLCVGVTHQ